MAFAYEEIATNSHRGGGAGARYTARGARRATPLAARLSQRPIVRRIGPSATTNRSASASDLRRRLAVATSSSQGRDLRQTLDSRGDLRRRLSTGSVSKPTGNRPLVRNTVIAPLVSRQTPVVARRITPTPINLLGGTTVEMENLVPGATVHDVKHVVARFGEVVKTALVPGSGTAYITFRRLQEAQRCVDELHGQVADGRVLRVTITRPQLQIRGSAQQQSLSHSPASAPARVTSNIATRIAPRQVRRAH